MSQDGSNVMVSSAGDVFDVAAARISAGTEGRFAGTITPHGVG